MSAFDPLQTWPLAATTIYMKWKTVLQRASIALSLGMIISCSPGAPESPTPASQNSAFTTYQELRTRNVYSPEFATDPCVIEEQRRVAQALRLSCEQFKTHCKEAEQAQQFIAAAEARR